MAALEGIVAAMEVCPSVATQFFAFRWDTRPLCHPFCRVLLLFDSHSPFYMHIFCHDIGGFILVSRDCHVPTVCSRATVPAWVAEGLDNLPTLRIQFAAATRRGAAR